MSRDRAKYKVHTTLFAPDPPLRVARRILSPVPRRSELKGADGNPGSRAAPDVGFSPPSRDHIAIIFKCSARQARGEKRVSESGSDLRGQSAGGDLRRQSGAESRMLTPENPVAEPESPFSLCATTSGSPAGVRPNHCLSGAPSPPGKSARTTHKEMAPRKDPQLA